MDLTADPTVVHFAGWIAVHSAGLTAVHSAGLTVVHSAGLVAALAVDPPSAPSLPRPGNTPKCKESQQ